MDCCEHENILEYCSSFPSPRTDDNEEPITLDSIDTYLQLNIYIYIWRFNLRYPFFRYSTSPDINDDGDGWEPDLVLLLSPLPVRQSVFMKSTAGLLLER